MGNFETLYNSQRIEFSSVYGQSPDSFHMDNGELKLKALRTHVGFSKRCKTSTRRESVSLMVPNVYAQRDKYTSE